MKSLFHEIGPIRFELRGELESSEASFHTDAPEPELWILRVEMRAAAGVSLPEVTLSFPVPMQDVQVRWMPDFPACHHLLPYCQVIRASYLCNLDLFQSIFRNI